MSGLDQIAFALGFKDEKELHKLVSGLPLTNPLILRAFEVWKDTDGSKEGLLKLYKKAGVEP